MRDPDDPERPAVIEAIKNHESLTIDILYGDGEGGQRVITRFAVIPIGEATGSPPSPGTGTSTATTPADRWSRTGPGLPDAGRG